MESMPALYYFDGTDLEYWNATGLSRTTFGGVLGSNGRDSTGVCKNRLRRGVSESEITICERTPGKY